MITVTKGLECSLSMARLAAAFQVRKDVLELERTKKVTKLRLMADPMVSVDQIQDALEGFMKHKKSSDLWRLNLTTTILVTDQLANTTTC